jgi:putative endonuclease
MGRYYVYILQCADLSYYTGITNDIERRLLEHQSGYRKTAYTYDKRPVKLVFYEEFDDPVSAIAFEKQLKGWSRKKKEALIEQDWDKLKVLAECKNKTSYKNYRKVK